MNGKPEQGGRGPGGRGETPTPGTAGQGAAPADRLPADRLLAMDAADAVAELSARPGAAGADIGSALDAGAVDAFPGPIAEAAYWDDSTVAAIMGPVGSGKTTTLLKSRLRRAMMMPRSVIDGRRHYKLVVIRATYRQLWSTTIPDFLKVYPAHLGAWAGGKGGPASFRMVFSDGAPVPPAPGHDGDWASDEIVFEAEFMAFGDDIEGSMRGLQATDVWMHEMDTNPIDVVLNAVTRINRHPGADHKAGYPAQWRDYGQIIGDMNAPEPDNWTVPLLMDPERRADTVAQLNAKLPAGARHLSVSFHRQPGFGEPGCENMANLGPGYYPGQIAVMKLLGRGDKIDRLVYNRIVHTRAGEPVFSREFNPRIHIAGGPLQPEPGIGLRIGLDQGFKAAAVVGQFVPPFQWRILAELHLPDRHLLAAEFGRLLRDLIDSRFPGARIEGGWGDMAGEAGSSLASDEVATWNLLVGRAAGFRVRPQKLGANRIQPRLEAVRAGLEYLHGGQPGLLIDPGCRFLLAGFEARYVWTEETDASGARRKVPDKRLTEANVMDALQYLMLSEHRGLGASPVSFPSGKTALMGHNGGPPMPPEAAGGLRTGFDVLNPYGG